MIETFTRAVLITGKDSQGNEITYSKVDGEWYCLYYEMPSTYELIQKYVIPLVCSIRFGNIALTRLQWIALGCPFEMSNTELERIRLPNDALKI